MRVKERSSFHCPESLKQRRDERGEEMQKRPLKGKVKKKKEKPFSAVSELNQKRRKGGVRRNQK